MPCECGYDGVGYCPLPTFDYMESYIETQKLLDDADKCNTLDRRNILAQRDCGLG